MNGHRFSVLPVSASHHAGLPLEHCLLSYAHASGAFIYSFLQCFLTWLRVFYTSMVVQAIFSHFLVVRLGFGLFVGFFCLSLSETSFHFFAKAEKLYRWPWKNTLYLRYSYPVEKNLTLRLLKTNLLYKPRIRKSFRARAALRVHSR